MEAPTPNQENRKLYKIRKCRLSPLAQGKPEIQTGSSFKPSRPLKMWGMVKEVGNKTNLKSKAGCFKLTQQTQPSQAETF